METFVPTCIYVQVYAFVTGTLTIRKHWQFRLLQITNDSCYVYFILIEKSLFLSHCLSNLTSVHVWN